MRVHLARRFGCFASCIHKTIEEGKAIDGAHAVAMELYNWLKTR